MTNSQSDDIAIQAVSKLIKNLPVAGAFIYGSYAQGTSKPTSDIDTFLILYQEVEHIGEVFQAFTTMQRDLGYTPDSDYPVELFTIDSLMSTLDELDIQSMLGTLALESGGDEWEIIHALTSNILKVRWCFTLDQLVSRAQSIFHASVTR